MVAELVLSLFVLLRPRVDVVDDELVRPGSAELVCDPTVAVWRLRESSPNTCPLTLPGGQLFGGGDLTVSTRVEAKVGLALLHERSPTRRVNVCLEDLWVVKPPQEASDDVLVHELE
ncbi:hypothetical protein RHRU231_960059 [Rhodococcus ruber]|uniref:Uncharacterized protein n=1 Tax=Rhodococcus ruber TaxID=1830 RepID=A0A098BWC8_9NOCA|nr:hypothetical protein RHRU231_960059 [Rhodococcus ruber]